jgi:hypothetical protein
MVMLLRKYTYTIFLHPLTCTLNSDADKALEIDPNFTKVNIERSTHASKD